MEELEEFLKEVIRDSKKLNSGEYIITPFLDETYQKRLEDSFKYNKSINILKNGGIINSLRNRVIISKDSDDINFDIEIYRIDYNKKFGELSHRSILGSLMSLGIKRECLGDIICYNDNWYIAITKEIAKYIKENFTSVGKVMVDLVKTDEVVENVITLEYKTYFLSSLRLDLVVKDAFYIPRNLAQKEIELGKVFVNHLPILDSDFKLKIGDEVNLRGKGKIKLVEELGKSKSDKLVIKIGRYV